MPIEITIYFLVFSLFAIVGVYEEFRDRGWLWSGFSLVESLFLGAHAFMFWRGPKPGGTNWIIFVLLAAMLVEFFWNCWQMRGKVSENSRELPADRQTNAQVYAYANMFVAWLPAYYFAFQYSLGMHAKR